MLPNFTVWQLSLDSFVHRIILWPNISRQWCSLPIKRSFLKGVPLVFPSLANKHKTRVEVTDSEQVNNILSGCNMELITAVKSFIVAAPGLTIALMQMAFINFGHGGLS
jgi:hypothetical protein